MSILKPFAKTLAFFAYICYNLIKSFTMICSMHCVLNELVFELENEGKGFEKYCP